MTILSTQLGPRVRSINTESLWGLIASIWIGSEMLIVLNLPLIGIWIMLLSVPYRWLFPSSVRFRVKDLYATNNSTFDIWMVGLFGFMGDLLIKPRDRACAAFLLGFILSPVMEENLSRNIEIFRGDWSVFVTRLISAGLLAAAALLLVVVLLPSVLTKQEEAFVED
jgi:putative tricarboxylic transport membrane protein